MVFSSNVFLLVFLPLFLIVYFACPKRFRNWPLLLFSIVFYAWGAPDFIFFLLGSLVVNFYLVKAMCRTEKRGLKKLFCGLSIGVSLGLLAYFKYANFFVDNLNVLLTALGAGSITLAKILLPIGISFFSFQSVTYTLDTCRGVNEPLRRLSDYMVYIIMFPQLVAGPIVRYCDVQEQLLHRESKASECLQGLYRFVVGLCKKVLVADVLGAQVDITLGGDLALLDSGTAWVAIIAYTMQLYFDFSGYSDMAIGLGRIIGFKFPENFDNPYNSTSITEFWRRWHITLGAFMRNYLYIPLGGNRKGVGRTYFNLWIVFLLSGLWHGASWNFVIWGAYHGFWLVLERLCFKSTKNRHPLMAIPTFVIAVVGWVFFRIETLPDALTLIGRLFAFDFGNFALGADAQFYAMLAVALFFAFFCLLPFGKRIQEKIYYTEYSRRGHIAAFAFAVMMLFFCIGAFNAVGFSPFIYFRF